MTDDISGQTAQQQIYSTAVAMKDGSLNYLAGSITLERLRREIGAYENDPVFMPFIAVLAEIDSLDIGRDPSKWSADTVNATEPEIAQAIEWARSMSLLECESLIKRYETAK